LHADISISAHLLSCTPNIIGQKTTTIKRITKPSYFFSFPLPLCHYHRRTAIRSGATGADAIRAWTSTRAGAAGSSTLASFFGAFALGSAAGAASGSAGAGVSSDFGASASGPAATGASSVLVPQPRWEFPPSLLPSLAQQKQAPRLSLLL
jgi:hypothetical protein